MGLGPQGRRQRTRQDGAGLPSSEHFNILILIQSSGQPGEVFRAKMKISFYNGGNEVHSCDRPTLMAELREDVSGVLGQMDSL